MSSDPLAGFFEEYTTDAATADAAAAERTASGVRYISLSKLPPGDYVYRILPPRPGQKSPLVVRYTHFVKGADGKTKAVRCAKLQNGGACAVDDQIDALTATNNPVDKKLA